ncbi:MAG: aminopeptidase P family protein [Kiloniellales bacterium]|nr:aminopeptidase P family protein [Kiloniellales bacterium]
MPDSAPNYAGDAELDRLLAAAGADLGAAAVRDILAGVLAAPEAEDPEAWMDLVAEARSPELAGQLAALKRDLAAELDDGLGAEADHAARLADLRAELARRGLQGFLVPRSDEHQGEYVPARAQRLAWLTGFTGSAGAALVLVGKAAVFVDGRYTLQVRRQVDTSLFAPVHLADQSLADWIAEHLKTGETLGYDPWLHSEAQVKGLRAVAEKAGGGLVPCESNPLDAVWRGQPVPPLAPVRPHDLTYAGQPAAEKRAQIGAGIEARGAEAAVLTLPDSIAWLLNVRGGDVTHTPFALSFAIQRADGGTAWFIDERKLTAATRQHLGNAVAVEPPEAFGPALEALGQAGAKVTLDPASAPDWAFERLRQSGAKLIPGPDPCLLPKARKNEVEIAGAHAAHLRDGAAVTRFLAWLTAEASARAGEDPVTEIEAEERLAAFRRENEAFRDLSFDTISGAGPNGAIVHYRVDAASNRALGTGELYLVDSGAQYPDGTTDVTRTLAIGEPTAEMRDRFTRVLKGHIAIATARFPKGTTGSQLDTLARRPLWEAGLDFDHGTGHGVGSYLSVHEGPQRISKTPNPVPLEPGMIVSNEPGYYKEEAYGIRIENLVTVVPLSAPPESEREILGFETLTLAPIDRSLIDASLLDGAETAWLDAYHARVRSALTPELDPDTAAWLAAATAPLAGDQ